MLTGLATEEYHPAPLCRRTPVVLQLETTTAEVDFRLSNIRSVEVEQDSQARAHDETMEVATLWTAAVLS